MEDFHQNPTVQNRYRTPRESLRESREAMSARRSERPPQAWRWDSIAVLDGIWIMKKEPMAWQTDYGIMKEGMSILRGRKSVPGISSSERENGKK
nr:hypothetical protein [Tanacetum cinerariifolium]